MKFQGDKGELLRALWSAVERTGGRPTVNMIQKMARLAGAAFDDKAAHALLCGNPEKIADTEVEPKSVRHDKITVEELPPSLFDNPFESGLPPDPKPVAPVAENLNPEIAMLMEIAKKAAARNAAAALPRESMRQSGELEP
jgi:hypothetical protein